MKTIKEYIQFAIDNWDKDKKPLKIYKIGWQYRIAYQDESIKFTTLEGVITSKEFIEAIAIGIYIEEKDDDGEIIPISFYELDITYKQALAIRDGELPQFITNILPGKQ